MHQSREEKSPGDEGCCVRGCQRRLWAACPHCLEPLCGQHINTGCPHQDVPNTWLGEATDVQEIHTQQQEAQPPQPPLYIHTAGNRQPDLQRRVAMATPVSLIEGMQLYVDTSGMVVNSEGVMGPWRVEKPNAGNCLAI